MRAREQREFISIKKYINSSSNILENMSGVAIENYSTTKIR
nr:hypothetical protein [uncultured Romboutsia sp.]